MGQLVSAGHVVALDEFQYECQRALDALRQAVAEALERKRRLGEDEAEPTQPLPQGEPRA